MYLAFHFGSPFFTAAGGRWPGKLLINTGWSELKRTSERIPRSLLQGNLQNTGFQEAVSSRPSMLLRPLRNVSGSFLMQNIRRYDPFQMGKRIGHVGQLHGLYELPFKFRLYG